MDTFFTTYLRHQIDSYSDADANGEEQWQDIVTALMDNDEYFRTFDQGLKQTLQKSGYSGDLSDQKETVNYLYKKMSELSPGVTKNTIKGWVTGKQCPDTSSHKTRTYMYQLCFALQLSFEDMKWFFNNVYFGRCFNYRSVEEAVYSYCFQHNLSYQTALRLIDTVQKAPDSNLSASTVPSNFTYCLMEEISNLSSEEELVNFLIKSKPHFRKWNQTALHELKKLMEEISGSPEEKELINNIKDQLIKEISNLQNAHREKKKKYDPNNDPLQNDSYRESLSNLGKFTLRDQEFKSLLIREMYMDAPTDTNSTLCYTLGEHFYNILKSRHISQQKERDTFSRDYILYYIFYGMNKDHEKSEHKKVETETKTKQENMISWPKKLNSIFRNNFPSKAILSSILDENKISSSNSYDAIRKTLILLNFYTYWCKIKLDKSNYVNYTSAQLSESFVEQTNRLLYTCGYESLTPPNPYDFVFLSISMTSSPLDCFRGVMLQIAEEYENSENTQTQ